MSFVHNDHETCFPPPDDTSQIDLPTPTTHTEYTNASANPTFAICVQKGKQASLQKERDLHWNQVPPISC